MCPLWPFHFILLYLLLLCPVFFFSSAIALRLSSSVKEWPVKFHPKQVNVYMYDTVQVNYWTDQAPYNDSSQYQLFASSSDPEIASMAKDDALVQLKMDSHQNNEWRGNFNLTANFIGYASVKLRLFHKTPGNESFNEIWESNPLLVSVSRKMRVIDHVFTSSVAVLVAIIFVNFGCALDWPLLKECLYRPVGPTIGFISQFLFMPLISFFLAKVLFPDSVAMQLGLFFTGVAPGGGASNVWIYLLGGNLNLSITMTAVSTIGAFVMIPMWTFTIGKLIFDQGNLAIPYTRIASVGAALIVPLSIGFFLQRHAPKMSKFLVQILKPFSGCLILFIVVFATITNFYLFKLFTWRILLGGLGLPWLGYVFGYLLARAFNQPPEDRLAISIETGIQNTGIAIFMLRFSLGQPEGDLTTVLPVAVAIMTPFPLMACYLIQKVWKQKARLQKGMPLPTTEEFQNNVIHQPINGHIYCNDHVKSTEKF